MGVRWRPKCPSPGEPGGTSGSGKDWLEQYGRGRRDPATGLFEWYEIPEEIRARESQPLITWAELLVHWPEIEADLHERYGIDVEDRDLMRSRSWRWLQTRIVGLLSLPKSRLTLAMRPPPEQEHEPVPDE